MGESFSCTEQKKTNTDNEIEETLQTVQLLQSAAPRVNIDS